MRKYILTILIASLISLTANAQYDLTITYDATSGISNLGGATEIYMHSGASDIAGPLDTTAWHYVVGNWGANDSIGLMSNIFGNFWSITIDPVNYYSQASNGPVTGTDIQRIGMIFRNETGTDTGWDASHRSIYLDLSTPSPAAFNSDGSPFFGVTAGITAGINSPSSAHLAVRNAPNPFSAATVFSYNLYTSQNVALKIYDSTGRLVKNLFNEFQSAGIHYYNWIGDDSSGKNLANGVYYYFLNSGNEKSGGKLVIIR